MANARRQAGESWGRALLDSVVKALQAAAETAGLLSDAPGEQFSALCNVPSGVQPLNPGQPQEDPARHGPGSRRPSGERKQETRGRSQEGRGGPAFAPSAGE